MDNVCGSGGGHSVVLCELLISLAKRSVDDSDDVDAQGGRKSHPRY